jgi:DNA mismatch endonuclease (patch repair protein)
MADRIPTPSRSRNMRHIRSKNTEPEIRIRRLLYKLGYRYRLHVGSLPGCPDLVFRGRRKIVFVHGCFWHQHQSCGDAHLPKSRIAYWHPKLKRNVERDAQNERSLKNKGWEILTLWACEIRDEQEVSVRLQRFLDGKNITQPKTTAHEPAVKPRA